VSKWGPCLRKIKNENFPSIKKCFIFLYLIGIRTGIICLKFGMDSNFLNIFFIILCIYSDVHRNVHKCIGGLGPEEELRPTPAGLVRWRYWHPKDQPGTQIFLLHPGPVCPSEKYHGASFIGQQSIRTRQILLGFYPSVQITRQFMSHD
jgi:hypothetical protein